MIFSIRTKTFNRKPKTENRKLSTALLWLMALALVIGSCGRGPLQKGPVIVFGSPDSPRLRQAVAGLQAALLKEGPVEVVCAPEFGPEARETLRRVRERRPRLLVVLGTPALLLAAPMVKQIPMVFGLVADPYFTRAAFDPAHPETHQENVTGIASPAPLEAAFKHGASLLGKGPWGLLYDPNDGVAVDLARRFEQEAPRFGVQPLTETSAGAATDAEGLARLMQRGARVIYLPPTRQRDSLCTAAAGLGPPDESPGGERPPRRISSRGGLVGGPGLPASGGGDRGPGPTGPERGAAPNHPHCGKGPVTGRSG